jgi:hypothetical protein
VVFAATFVAAGTTDKGRDNPESFRGSGRDKGGSAFFCRWLFAFVGVHSWFLPAWCNASGAGNEKVIGFWLVLLPLGFVARS